MPVLQLRVGSRWKTIWELDKNQDIAASLGRSSQNDVVVAEPQISRHQAEIFFANDHWKIRNVGRDSGIKAAGQIVTELDQVLSHGDLIRLGSCEFLFLDTDLPEQDPGSVSAWVQKLQGDSKVDQAQFELWRRYYDRLARLARRKLGDLPRRIADEEDAAAGAFNSFFEGVQAGKFPRLDDRTDLWNILATIAARKVCRQIEREMAKKRGGGQVAGEAVLDDAGDSDHRGIENIAQLRTDNELYVEFEDTWTRYLDSLDDEKSRQIAELRLGGFTNNEIAAQMQMALRTVERRLCSIRKTWDDQFSQEVG